jgi:hypothetical protein
MAFSLPQRMDVALTKVALIRRLLGQPHNESTLQSSGTPFFYQTIWKCGCSMEHVHEDQGAYWWEACEAHSALRPKP